MLLANELEAHTHCLPAFNFVWKAIKLPDKDRNIAEYLHLISILPLSLCTMRIKAFLFYSVAFDDGLDELSSP